jgi:uncharacterized membrane protein YeaQ/YmgE (transglycosylase-associated protein family)
MGLIITILAGAFIGWIASMIMGTNASMGALANIIAGLVGAFVGGFIANLLGFGAQVQDSAFRSCCSVFSVRASSLASTRRFRVADEQSLDNRRLQFDQSKRPLSNGRGLLLFPRNLGPCRLVAVLSSAISVEGDHKPSAATFLVNSALSSV